MDDLMPIGEFAAASRLSQKALRLYGEKGLLAPAWVDPDSGYRYYRPEQLKAATLIAVLRSADVPLAEIRRFLREPTVAWLEEYEQRTVAELADRRRVLRYAKRVPRSDGEQHLPSGEVAFTAISGAQCDFPEILGAYESVYRWAKEHGREPAGPPREIYVNGMGEPLQMEIALPLR